MNILVLYALMVIHWCLKGSHGDFMGCRGVCVEVSLGFIKFYWGFIEVHDLRGFLYRYSKYGILSNHIFIYIYVCLISVNAYYTISWSTLVYKAHQP